MVIRFIVSKRVSVSKRRKMRLSFIKEADSIQEVVDNLEKFFNENKKLFYKDVRRDIFLSMSGKKKKITYNFSLYISDSNVEDYNLMKKNTSLFKESKNLITLK